MTEQELLKALKFLEGQRPTIEDWRDLYETIEAYKRRCLARAILASPVRDDILAAIKELAGVAQ
jgi:hypothetical protein